MQRQKLWATAIVVASMMLDATPASAQIQTGSQIKADTGSPLLRRVKNIQHPQLPSQIRQEASPRVWRAPMATTAMADGSMPISGNLLYARSWENLGIGEIMPIGYYTFAPQAPITLCAEYIDPYISANGGAVRYDDHLHMINYEEVYGYVNIYYSEYDTRTWENLRNEQIFDLTMVATDLAYDAKSGRTYGCFYNADATGYELGIIDYTNLTRRTICDLGRNEYLALAINARGEMYGIQADGNLYKVNKVNGKATKIGYVGFDPAPYLQSATFDPNSGLLYWAAQVDDSTSALYTLSTETGQATLVGTFADNEMLVGLFIPKAEAEYGAPAKAESLTASFDQGSTTGVVAFDVPTLNYGGGTLTGEVTYTLTTNGNDLASGTVMAGQHIQLTVTVTEGENNFNLTLSNTEGYGPSALLSRWIGYDYPEPVKEVTLSLDESTGRVTLTWKQPTNGTHGGFIDTASLCYNVTRYPDLKPIASLSQLTTATDDLDDTELHSYQYGITAVNAGKESAPTYSTKTVYGKPYDVPYREDFLTEDAMMDYTVIDLNQDDRTWEFHWDAVAYNYSEDIAGDDWLLTPPIRLESEKFYHFSFNYWSASQAATEILSVALGQGQEPWTYAQLMPETAINDKQKRKFETLVKVEQDGNYHFAFHATSPAGAWRLYVDAISVTENNSAAAPDSVAQLQVIPAPMGQLAATISFDAPTCTADGIQPLTAISRIEVWSNNTRLVQTLEDVTPGQHCEVEDRAEDIVNGYNSYSVIAYNTHGPGLTASTRAYIGLDIPQAPQHVTAQVSEHGIVLSWEAPTQGMHGGYIDATQLTYITQSADGQRYATDIADCQYTDDQVEMTGRQRLLQYLVAAVNTAGIGLAGVSNSVVVGDPHPLPFVESFAGGMPQNTGWYLTSVGQSSFRITSSISADDDMGSVLFYPSFAGDEAIINTGKLDISQVQNPNLIFTYFAFPGSQAHLLIEMSINGGTPQEVADIDYSQLTCQMGWQKAIIPLPGTEAGAYVQLHFHATCQDAVTPIMFDEVAVRDLLDHNLSIQMAIARHGRAGVGIQAYITITNNGMQEAATYAVTLRDADGRILATVDRQHLESLQSERFELPFTPLAGYGEQMELFAEVEYTDDQDQSDNLTPLAMLQIDQNIYPSVSQLTIDSNRTLRWQLPDARDLATRTDDFESYRAWETFALGDWTTYDRDGGSTLGIYGLDYPLSYWAYAFGVFNPLLMQMNYDQSPNYRPHSGDQFMASFAVDAHEVSCGGNDDWLVSPRLNGESQTISLWAKSAQPSFLESFQILASQTGHEPEDFTQVVAEYNGIASQWLEYTAQLDEGTRYFAIRNVSKDKLALFVDDVTFCPAPPTMLGCNLYRDGQWISFVPIDFSEYTDNDSSASTSGHYQASVVYAEGESVLCEPIIFSSIENIATDHTAIPLRYNLMGQSIRGNADNGSLPAGIYVIRSGEKKSFEFVR